MGKKSNPAQLTVKDIEPQQCQQYISKLHEWYCVVALYQNVCIQSRHQYVPTAGTYLLRSKEKKAVAPNEWREFESHPLM